MCYLLAICFMKKNCLQRSVNYNYVNGSIFILNYDSWLIRMQVIFFYYAWERSRAVHSDPWNPILVNCSFQYQCISSGWQHAWYLYSLQFWSQGGKAKSKNIIKHILLSKLSVEEEKWLGSDPWSMHWMCSTNFYLKHNLHKLLH